MQNEIKRKEKNGKKIKIAHFCLNWNCCAVDFLDFLCFDFFFGGFPFALVQLHGVCTVCTLNSVQLVYINSAER